jgi:CheY-like chemotaxis protein
MATQNHTSGLVAAIRSRGGYTQEGLARHLGVSFATVNSWERGRSTPHTSHLESIRELARGLGIQTDLVVLVIDDDPAACMVIEGLVAGSTVPAKVVTTIEPARGLILCGAVEPSLLLLDIMMPEIDGFELAGQLRDILGDRMPIVVFVTASTEDGVDMRAAELGHRILRKPLRQETVDGLLQMVNTGIPRPPNISG